MSEHCPYCEKYIEVFSKDDPDFGKEWTEQGCFWASLKEVKELRRWLNNVPSAEEALKMGYPVTINMKSGNEYFGRFWSYDLAEKRDKKLEKRLQHFWIWSGGCISYMTPVCCELANAIGEEAAKEWEKEHFE